IMAWLNALASHRRVTRQMISGKFEPGHLHIQIPGIMRVSRTVQWFREAAHRDAAYVQRAFEEVATTSIYLATFCYWMHDDSPGSSTTEAFLERLLGIAERFAHATVGPSAAVLGSDPEAPA
ncbi:MAG: TetR/AcrR family transcriptional regulator, partial [Gammaproteobacteria bacterium]